MNQIVTEVIGEMRLIFKPLQGILSDNTHLVGGTLCFLMRSFRSLSPTCLQTSARVDRAVSLTNELGSLRSFTKEGTSFDTDTQPAPCLNKYSLQFNNNIIVITVVFKYKIISMKIKLNVSLVKRSLYKQGCL